MIEVGGDNMRSFYNISIFILAVLLGVFGGWIIFNPEISLRAMTLTLGFIFIFHGVVEVFSFIRERTVWNISFFYLFSGLISLGLGIFTFWQVEFAETTFVLVISIWIFATAILQIAAAISLRDFRGWGYLLTIGLVLFIFAIISFMSKEFFATGLSVLIGSYFIVQAIAIFLFAIFLYRMRTMGIFRD